MSDTLSAATKAAPDAIAATIAELVSGGSVEMSAHNLADAGALGDLLPAGTKVYVNHLPRHTLADTLAALEAVHRAGLEPVPHVAARRVASRKDLEAFAQRAVRDAGVRKVLLIGGDDAKPAGPYADSVALLASGVLAACGVREIGIAGYPEGHARIGHAALEQAIKEKLALAAQQGLGAYVVTQFSFAPARVIEYCSELARLAPAVPVYVGMAGPADATTLLRYAQRCGVSASLRALRAQGMGLVRLVTHTDPAEQLTAVAHYCLGRRTCNVVGAHFFSFGGSARTAKWMNSAIVGQES